MNQTEFAQASQKPRVRRAARAAGRVSAARVTIAWTPAQCEGASAVARTELELVAELEAASSRTWTCQDSFGVNWVEAISSARCSEVVVTARLGNDVPAKHLVLELAELLTLKLTESQPLIRVLFLPESGASRAARTHA